MNDQVNNSIQLPYMTVSRSAVLLSGQSFTLDDIYKTNELDALAKIQDEEFQTVFNSLRNEELTRAYVSGLYKDDNYKALIATLLWGHIFVSNLKSVLEDKNLSKKIENIKKYIDSNHLEKAFTSLLNGDDKINGIGVAFFTKILYFLSYDRVGNMPLIYDKWTQSIHASLLESEGKHEFKFFKNTRGGYKGLNAIDQSKLFELYCDYNSRMATIANQLELARADMLEMYLFGRSKTDKDNWNDTNPRFNLYNHMVSLCNQVPTRTERSARNSRRSASETETVIQEQSESFDMAVTLHKIKNGFFIKEFAENSIDTREITKVTLSIGGVKHTCSSRFANVLKGGLFPKVFNELLSSHTSDISGAARIIDGELTIITHE